MRSKRILKCGFVPMIVYASALVLTGQSTKPLYENDFEKAATGPVSNEFLVQDGVFTVKEEGGNRFLELPGEPLDTYGLYFGPTEKEGIGVSARFFGTGKGRRSPTFAVGLGAGGLYRLQVSPAKKAMELYKGESVKATIPHEWQSATWTFLRLQVRKLKDGEWKVEGKVWTQGKPEPEALRFLARYRASYQQILAKLTANGGPTLYQFDTSHTSIEQIAEKVLAACDRGSPGSRE